MKITIESTPDLVPCRGIECRRWEGITGGGARCHVFVASIGIASGMDAAEFERELLDITAQQHASPGVGTMEAAMQRAETLQDLRDAHSALRAIQRKIDETELDPEEHNPRLSEAITGIIGQVLRGGA